MCMFVQMGVLGGEVLGSKISQRLYVFEVLNQRSSHQQGMSAHFAVPS